MNFWCCSFLFVTCVHTGVIFCSLYFLAGDCNEGSQPCPQGRGSLWMERSLLKSWGSGCKMEEHSSALHCVQHPDQCRSLCSQREHICHIPSILSFYSVWFRRGLVRSKYLDTKGMWKREAKNFKLLGTIYLPQKKMKSDRIFMCLLSLKIKIRVCKSSFRNFHDTGTVNRSMLAGWGTCGKPFT